MAMTSALDITRSVRPPRSVFVNYPLGHQTGRPGDPAGQRDIVVRALGAAESIAVPGAVVELPLVWDEGDDRWEETDYRPGYLPPYERQAPPQRRRGY